MSILIRTFYIFAVFTIHSVQFSATLPQIFNETYTFCEFRFNAGKTIVFPNKLWTINTKELTLHFSICKYTHPECRNQTTSCLLRKSTNEFIDLGSEFAPADSDDFILVSNGAKCPSNPSKNHTLALSLQCSDSMRPKPRLMPSEDEDDCHLEVTMMRPDCRPKCTELIQNAYLLDIRDFPKNIPVESDSKKFSLSLCGSNRVCSGDTSVCEILDTSTVPLAKIDSQHLEYDATKNELTARGRYKQNRVLRDVQVLIKCNWESELSNATYKKVPVQGKHYRFELESTFGCVKLPHTCALSSIDNLNYDLTKVYKEEGWRVLGVPEGEVILNICGPLNQIGGLCAVQHSQVCHLDKGTYINRGSILSFLKAYNDFIKAIFVSGSTCKENPQLLYSTEIEFRCSKSENGPIFKEYKPCVMIVTWETPHACPIDYYKGQDCYMSDRLSNRNLKKIYAQTDNVYSLSPDLNTKLIYNLCGPIHQKCNNFTNASFCLQTENKETVIAWDTRELISEGGLLRMELSGSSCENGISRGEVIVNFVCNYNSPASPSQMNVIEDSCKYNLTIFTPLACISPHKFEDCVYNVGDSCYDLSPLSDKSRNYVIPGDENTNYVFNLCGPIVSGPGALCTGDTMFCLRNKTEVNIKYQYVSLGGVGTPRLDNNSLVVEARMGSLCEEYSHYKTVIHFECSQEKFLPEFVSKEPCVYRFNWKTPEACPHEKQCVINGSKPDTHTWN